MSRFSFGLPFGWYPVAWSHELAKGEVVRRRYFDRELVLFRGDTGRASNARRRASVPGCLFSGGAIVDFNLLSHLLCGLLEHLPSN